jgi:hypothetical protein
MDHSCQRRKLASERHGLDAVDRDLAHADRVDQLDAGEHGAGGLKRFEVEHRPGHPLNGAVILLDNVVQILNLAHQDRHVAAGVDRIHGRLVSAALVHRDLVWIAVHSHGLVEEALRSSYVALRRQQEIDGFALLVDGAVEVFPGTLDRDVRLIHAPATADRALVFAGHFLDQRQEADRPSINRRMVDRHAALLHYLLEVPVAQRISGVPADADQNHINRKAHTFEVEHVDLSWIRHRSLPDRPASVR